MKTLRPSQGMPDMWPEVGLHGVLKEITKSAQQVSTTAVNS